MKPIYQTPETKARERAIARAVAEHWNCVEVEFPAFSSIDWYFRRLDRMAAIVEVKGKPKQTWREFSTVFLDCHKYLALSHGGMAFSCPAFFIVGFDDAICYIDAKRLPGLPVRVCGRADRNSFDIQPCFQVPAKWLTRLPITEDKPDEEEEDGKVTAQ